MTDEEFREYKLLILEHMRHTDERFDKIDIALLRLNSSLLALQIKSAVWGATTGTLASLVLMIIGYVVQSKL